MVNREDLVLQQGPEQKRWIARCATLAVLMLVVLSLGVVLLEAPAPDVDSAVAGGNVPTAVHGTARDQRAGDAPSGGATRRLAIAQR